MSELPKGVSINSIYRIQRFARQYGKKEAADEADRIGVSLSVALAYEDKYVKIKNPTTRRRWLGARRKAYVIQAPTPPLENDGWIGGTGENNS